jgi:hypothetical protein
MLEIGKMEREAIEKLAMDSAAGQLNEDAETLLQEYLTEHPEANKWFQDMQEIYETTQVAFDTKTSSVKQPTENKPYLKFNWFPVLRRAAVIAIAVTIGITAGRWSKSEIPQQKLQQVATSSDTATKSQGIRLEDIGEGFWRDKVMAMMNSSPAKMHRDYISGPSLWEKYNKYKGDKL